MPFFTLLDFFFLDDLIVVITFGGNVEVNNLKNKLTDDQAEKARQEKLDRKRKYGYCDGNLVGMYLVDRNVADTRAIKIAEALGKLYSAITACDEWQLENLIKEERHIVEIANWFAKVENSFDPIFKDKTFDKELKAVNGLIDWSNPEVVKAYCTNSVKLMHELLTNPDEMDSVKKEQAVTNLKAYENAVVFTAHKQGKE